MRKGGQIRRPGPCVNHRRAFNIVEKELDCEVAKMGVQLDEGNIRAFAVTKERTYLSIVTNKAHLERDRLSSAIIGEMVKRRVPPRHLE